MVNIVEGNAVKERLKEIIALARCAIAVLMAGLSGCQTGIEPPPFDYDFVSYTQTAPGEVAFWDSGLLAGRSNFLSPL